MTDLERAIHNALDSAGGRPPKITHYANCIAVSFRNGDNLRVLVTLDLDIKPEAAAHKISQAFKVKAENQPSEEAMRKFNTESAEEAYERVSKLAGLDPGGGILPPPSGAEIDRSPLSFWKNKFTDKE